MNHSLQIDKITSIENLNHPNDFHIYFRGGCLTFNASNGPLRFWYYGQLVVLASSNDVAILKERLREMSENRNAEFSWEMNYGL